MSKLKRKRETCGGGKTEGRKGEEEEDVAIVNERNKRSKSKSLHISDDN